MNSIKAFWLYSTSATLAFMLPWIAFAQDAATDTVITNNIPTPLPSQVVVLPVVDHVASLGDLGQMLFSAIGSFKSVGWQAGVIALVALLVASLKTPAIKAYVWDRLKWGQTFVAPVLALIVAEITAMPTGQAFTPKTFIIAAITGAGAIALHEMLDAIKSIPGVSDVWISIAEFADKFLAKPEQIPQVRQERIAKYAPHKLAQLRKV